MARNYFAPVDSTCRICGRTLSDVAHLGMHITRTHKMSRKVYYDMFYKKDGEGVCLKCGKETRFEKLSFGYNHYCSRQCSNSDTRTLIARKKTVQERYGVDHVMKLNEVKQRRAATTKKHLGVEHPSQCPIVVELQKKTMFARYGSWYTQTEEYRKKSRMTSRLRYGVDSPNQSEEVKGKQRRTLVEHYGDRPWRHEEIIAKRKATCLHRYGADSYPKTEECKKKMEETCKLRYGVRNHMQNYESFMRNTRKRKNKITINGIVYDSLWEFKYEKFLIEHNIVFEYHPSVFFVYSYKGKEHRYYPDFLIRGENGDTVWIEVKGDYMAKDMVRAGTKARAKWECMMSNHVNVLFGKDLIDLGINGIRVDKSPRTIAAIQSLRKEINL